MRKTVIRVVKGIILLVAIVTLANMTYKHIRTYYDDYMDEYKGTESTQGEDVTVTIPEGASVKEIAQILKDNGLINYPRAFTKRLQDSEYRGKLHGGTYTLNTGMTTLQMMAAMSPTFEEDQPVDYLVVPEGFTVTVEESALRVYVLGKKSIISGIAAGDFVVKVDLSDMRTRAGKYEMPVSIYAPTKGYVWAVGEYSVTVDAKAS